jgi:hypothetical protein
MLDRPLVEKSPVLPPPLDPRKQHDEQHAEDEKRPAELMHRRTAP